MDGEQGVQRGEQTTHEGISPPVVPPMLTAPACKNATCPPDKTRIRLTDAGGLYLEVTPNGSKRWFWKYRFDGKEKRLALGNYDDVSLKDARADREAARKIHQSGTDPAQRRKLDKLGRKAQRGTTFEAVAREYHETKAGAHSQAYSDRWIGRMEKDLFPWLGSLPLADITAPLLLQTLRRVESRGAEDTAHTLRQTAGQVFRYGIQTGRCLTNPAPDLHGALKPVYVKHMAAVLEPAQVGALMRSIAAYGGQPSTRAALVLSALFFQRPGNVRAMEWQELDLDSDKPLWTIPSEKMKRTKQQKANGRPHLVPMAPQAVAILRELKPLTGHGRFVFPSLLTGERCMSENTLRASLRRLAYSNDDMTPHGFRAMARTVIAERLSGISPDVIEAQLGHGKSGPLGSAYDRADFMEQRRAAMTAWADYLDRLRDGAQVLPFKATAG